MTHAPLAPGQTIVFTVTKTDSQNRKIGSTPFTFTTPVFRPVLKDKNSNDKNINDKNAIALDMGMDWTTTGDKTGVINGFYLLGGLSKDKASPSISISPSIAGSVTEIAPDVANSADDGTALHFKFKLGTAPKSGDKLTITVSSKDAGGLPVTSQPVAFIPVP
jgi:hypothetical protein